MLRTGFFAAAAQAAGITPLRVVFGSSNTSGTNTSSYTFSNRNFGVLPAAGERRFCVVYLYTAGNSSAANSTPPNWVRANGVDMERLNWIYGAGNGGTTASIWLLEVPDGTTVSITVSLPGSAGRAGAVVYALYSDENGVEVREEFTSNISAAFFTPALVAAGDAVVTGGGNLAQGSAPTMAGGYMVREGSALVENTSYYAWASKEENSGVDNPNINWTLGASADSRAAALVVFKPAAPRIPIVYLGSDAASRVTGSVIEVAANIPQDCDFILVSFVSRNSGTTRAWNQAGCWVGDASNVMTAVAPLFVTGGRPHNGFQYFVNPPKGAQTVRVTQNGIWYSNASAMVVHYLKNVDPGDPILAQVNDYSGNNAHPIDFNINAAPGGFVAGCSCDTWNNRSYMADTINATLAFADEISGGNITTAHIYNDNPAAGAGNYGHDQTGTYEYSQYQGVSLRPKLYTPPPPAGEPLDAVLIPPQAGAVSSNKNYTMDIGTAAADRLVVIFVGQDTNLPTGCTINGVSAQQVEQAVISTASTTAFAAFVPAGDGNVTVNVTSSGTPKRQTCAGYVIYGAKSETPDAISNLVQVSSLSGEMTLSMPKTNGVIVGCATSGGGQTYTWTGLTEDFDSTIGVVGVSGASDGGVAYGRHTINVQQTASTLLAAFCLGWVA